MRKFASLLPEERKEVFQAVSVKKGLRPEIIEKDFWVSFMLDPNAVFAVQLDDGRNINAPVHGSLRAVYTRFACGDRVTVTLSPDGSYARVTGFAG